MNTDGAIALAETLLKGMASDYKIAYKKHLKDPNSMQKFYEWQHYERQILRSGIVWEVTGDAKAVISALKAKVEREVKDEKSRKGQG